jgi:HSP20 family protein
MSLRRDMSHWVSSFFSTPLFGAERVFAPVDIRERNGEYLITMDIPGVDQESLKITCQDHWLTISGERRDDRVESAGNVRYRECQYGSFSRTVPLPGVIDRDKIHASYRDGVLMITLPKANGSEGREVRIERAR